MPENKISYVKGEYGYQFSPFAGMPDNDVYDKYEASFSAEEAIGFGKALRRGTDPENQVVLYSKDGDVANAIVGISLFSNMYPANSYTVDSYVRVLRKGRVWVTVSVDVTAGNTAYVIPASGNFTNTSNNNANKRVGTFISTATNGNTALLEINLMG